MNRFPGILLATVFLLLTRCQLDSITEESVEIRISEDIILHMKPLLHSSGQSLNLVFESNHPYACDDAGYDYKLVTTSQAVQIQLFNLDVPDPCQGGYSPASEIVSMPEQPGTYALSIEIGGVIENKGKLFINHKSYELDLESRDGISIPNTTMLRIPNGTIWGYVYHPDHSQQVRDDLQSLLTPYIKEANLLEGYYGLFSAIAQQEISCPLPSDRSTAIPFVFNYTGNPAELYGHIHEVIEELPPDSEVKVFAWNGYVF